MIKGGVPVCIQCEQPLTAAEELKEDGTTCRKCREKFVKEILPTIGKNL